MAVAFDAPRHVSGDVPRHCRPLGWRACSTGSQVPLHRPDDSGVHAVRGTVHGRRVVGPGLEAARMGGLGAASCRHIVEGIEAVVREADPGDRVVAFRWCGRPRASAVARVVASIRSSPRCFVLRASCSSVGAGTAAGGAALTAIVVMSSAGRVFVTGPEVVPASGAGTSTWREWGTGCARDQVGCRPRKEIRR
jgi:acetyl-CoA/propionyl-CoA carboxylase carboxyl transferase subunit